MCRIIPLINRMPSIVSVPRTPRLPRITVAAQALVQQRSKDASENAASGDGEKEQQSLFVGIKPAFVVVDIALGYGEEPHDCAYRKGDAERAGNSGMLEDQQTAQTAD